MMTFIKKTSLSPLIPLSNWRGDRGEAYYKTANLKVYEELKELQKELKKNSTKAEKVLWEELRNKKLKFKFRRQHIIDDYVVDFVCLAKNLIIEVDGKIHTKRREYDYERTKELMSFGYRVIRFTNNEILYNLNSVMRKILTNLK